jgi:UDP-N-acetylmuramate--alanine ligase
VVYLLDVYPAREQPIPGVTSELIAAAMRVRGHAPVWTGGRTACAAAMVPGVRPGDVVITMGAGDVTHTGPELLASLDAAAA